MTINLNPLYYLTEVSKKAILKAHNNKIISDIKSQMTDPSPFNKEPEEEIAKRTHKRLSKIIFDKRDKLRKIEDQYYDIKDKIKQLKKQDTTDPKVVTKLAQLTSDLSRVSKTDPKVKAFNPRRSTSTTS